MSDTATKNWVPSYQKGFEYVESSNGVDWYDAPEPRRWRRLWHRCSAQTRAYMGGMFTERCACSAIRLGPDPFDLGPWMERFGRQW